MRALSPKERRFVAEYLLDQNGTQAAIRAGYTKRSARTTAARLLAKGNIAAAVNDKLKGVEEKSGLTATRVRQVVLALLTFDPRKAFRQDGTPLKSSELPDEVAQAIAGIDTIEDKDGYLTTKVRYTDRTRAAELAAKILGMLRVEITGKDGQPLMPDAPKINFAGLTTDQLISLAGMRHGNGHSD